MDKNFIILPLTQNKFKDAVDVVLRADLDTKGEIEHHLANLDAHFIAMDREKVVGVIGWYQDNVNYGYPLCRKLVHITKDRDSNWYVKAK